VSPCSVLYTWSWPAGCVDCSTHLSDIHIAQIYQIAAREEHTAAPSDASGE
jgi:hypothetical protein